MNKFIILIAEDDADDRFLLETAFAKKKYDEKLRFVENGVELMEHLHDILAKDNIYEMPSFILLDLNMPRKDGREALQEIKQHPVLKKIPVIIFTTTKSEHEIHRCYELGANTYIVKPSGFELLVRAIEDIRSYWCQTASVPVYYGGIS